MERLIIDLSGAGGLADSFQGDINDTTASPQRRYLGGDSQFADGIFNPIVKRGYISPANNKFVTITGSTNALLIANEYDSINDVAYFAESGNTIWKLDGIDDTSLTSELVINQSATEVLRDLEIYEINGTPALFYSYNITDNEFYSSQIGFIGLGDESGAQIFQNVDNDNTLALGTISAGGTYQRLAQSYWPTESISFNRIALPLYRAAADNGGYSVKITVYSGNFNYDYNDFERADGDDDVLSITDAAQTGLDLTDDFTFEAWIRPESSPGVGEVYTILSKSDDAAVGELGYFFAYQNSGGTYQLTLYMRHAGGNSQVQVSTGGSLSTSLWSHVAVTRDKVSGDVKFYLNGAQLDATQTGTTNSVQTNSTIFCIGGESETSGTAAVNVFDGKIDEVRVWNTDRTAAQIVNNYRYTLVGTETNLVAYWTFDGDIDGNGDRTSNNNDLTYAFGTSQSQVVSHATGLTSETGRVSMPYNLVSLASVTVSSTAINSFITGLEEEEAMTYFDLDATVTTDDPFWVVVEPTVFGDMSGSDSFTWIGQSLTPNQSIDSGDAARYDGTVWTPISTGGTVSDFSLRLLLTGSQTWSSTLVANTIKMDNDADIFMRRADNGFMYVFENGNVHSVDGTLTGGPTGTINELVLRFPSYFRCVDAVDTRGRMYIAVQSNPASGDSDGRAYSESIVGVYVWDRQSSLFGVRDFIPLHGARDIKKLYVTPRGEVRAVCIGEDRFTEIRTISSGDGEIVQRLGLSAYPETRDSLKSMNGGDVWLGADGIFYWHGKLVGQSSENLYKIGIVTSNIAGALTTGSIFVGHEETSQSRQGVYFSVLDGSTRENYKWYPHGVGTISSVAQLGAQGDVYTLVKLLPTLSTVRRLNLFMLPQTNTGTTTAATLKIYFNQSTTAWASKTITFDDCKKGWKKIEINQPNVNSMQLEVEFSTSNTLGTDDFQPMYAEVVYDKQGRIENSRQS